MKTKKIFLAGAAVLSLMSAVPAYAQGSEDAKATVGGAAGGAGGAALGFMVGGPVGAVIGGFAGAVLGAEAAVPEQTIVYAGQNPVQEVYVDGDVKVGTAVPQGVQVYPVAPTPQYGYFYANNRVYITDANSGNVVYSPGYVVPQDAVTYVEANPTASVTFSGDVVAGATLDGATTVTPVPNYPGYGYVYINDRPALIDMGSRTVVWVK